MEQTYLVQFGKIVVRTYKAGFLHYSSSLIQRPSWFDHFQEPGKRNQVGLLIIEYHLSLNGTNLPYTQLNDLSKLCQ